MQSNSNEKELLAYVDAALAGDAAALERLILALKDPLYRLALRMLGNFADAEDATQEILVKITTGLSSFERRASIRTWAFRVAVNHLRDASASRRRTAAESFEAVAEQLEGGIALTPDYRGQTTSADPALELEAREIGLHCTQGILMCLDIDQRAAYVLSEVFDFDSRTAAQILDISEPAYRQRLSRARRALESFMGTHCGLVHDEARCTCERQAHALRKVRQGKPLRIQFARGTTPSHATVDAARAELSRLQRIAVVFRNSPEWSAPDSLLTNVRRVLGTSPLLKTNGASFDE